MPAWHLPRGDKEGAVDHCWAVPTVPRPTGPFSVHLRLYHTGKVVSVMFVCFVCLLHLVCLMVCQSVSFSVLCLVSMSIMSVPFSVFLYHWLTVCSLHLLSNLDFVTLICILSILHIYLICKTMSSLLLFFLLLSFYPPVNIYLYKSVFLNFLTYFIYLFVLYICPLSSFTSHLFILFWATLPTF